MDIGVFIFATDYSMRLDELARELEARRFESLFVPEHTHIPTSRRSPFATGGELPEEYKHTHDPFVSLAYAAAVTTRLKIGTGTCPIIEPDTIPTAKAGRDMKTISVSAFAAPADRAVLDRFAAAGVTRSILRLPSEGRDKILPLLDQYAKLL